MVPILGIFIVLIPVTLMIYVLMCLIASRKPSAKSVLIIFLAWIVSIIACSVIAIRENASDKIRQKKAAVEQIFRSPLIINGDTTTLEQLLEDYDEESVIEEGRQLLHIAVPSQSIDITVNKNEGELKVNADGQEVLIRAGQQAGETEGEPGGRLDTKGTPGLRDEIICLTTATQGEKSRPDGSTFLPSILAAFLKNTEKITTFDRFLFYKQVRVWEVTNVSAF